MCKTAFRLIKIPLKRHYYFIAFRILNHINTIKLDKNHNFHVNSYMNNTPIIIYCDQQIKHNAM